MAFNGEEWLMGKTELGLEGAKALVQYVQKFSANCYFHFVLSV